MATSFAQRPQTFASPPVQQYPQFNFHRSSGSTSNLINFTPPSSVTPPSNNVSPSNVARQLYPQKQCGYIPAALRPTAMPLTAKRPLTPPRSAHSSVDSQTSAASFSPAKSLPATPTDDMSSFIAPFSTVTRVVTDEWHDEFGDVTGVPTRNHWKVRSDICTLSMTRKTD